MNDSMPNPIADGDRCRLPPRKPTIYVVDDDADVLGSLRFLLETDGFDVRTFRNGAALLNAPPSRPSADCFVIDYKMPDMNGIDLAQAAAQPRHRRADHSDHRLSRREHRGQGRERPASTTSCSSRFWTRALSHTIRGAIRRARTAAGPAVPPPVNYVGDLP